jgi:Mycoplasma protein of unknown function, DUF285
MFYRGRFNGDISGWNVSKVKDMAYMFNGSKFNGDISNWNVSKVENTREMFFLSNFNGDISKWNFHKNVDQSEESLARLIELGKQYEENRKLKMITTLDNSKTKNTRMSI